MLHSQEPEIERGSTSVIPREGATMRATQLHLSGTG